MGRQKFWSSLVEEYADAGYTVVPLTTSAALRDEGKRMRHCVGGYDESCMGSSYRVFSICEPSTGKSKATAAILLAGTRWGLNAVQGSCNRPVSVQLRQIAQRIADKYDAAWQRCMTAVPTPDDTGKK